MAILNDELSALPPSLLAELKRRHGEPQRAYHDWTHIEALLRHLEDAGQNIVNVQTVLYAILFHDAIYDPKAADNEQQSAALFVSHDTPLSQEDRHVTQRIIEATDGHLLPTDLNGSALSDCAHFLDMDLGILGASEERFDLYEEQIRFEYSHVAPEDYREGRAKVLRHFADRGDLYFTDWGRARFEDKARRNLERSLAKLGC